MCMYRENIVHRGLCTLRSSRHPLGDLERPLQIKGNDCALTCGLAVALLRRSQGRTPELWEPGWTRDLQTLVRSPQPKLSPGHRYLSTLCCLLITREMDFSVHDAS